jgi:hypothetical protein
VIADAIAEGGLQPVCSKQLLEEQGDVLSRDRIARYVPAGVAEKVHRLYLEAAAFFEPGPAPRICRDENDDYLLALASESQADYLVTRDADLLVLERHGGTEIIYPARFLQLLEASRRPSS